ncbi:MAG: hypothetical protein M3R13_04645 [Armatimonadota bacterium]|nr:hypothetical protein [Armatimonadota bacterium]
MNIKVALLTSLISLMSAHSSAQYGLTQRISTTADSREAYEVSTSPKVSRNGALVLFKSRAAEIVPGGRRTRNIYLKDTLTGIIEQISLNYDGSQPNGHSSDSDMTPDGRYVVFVNSFAQITPGVAGSEYLYKKDRLTGIASLVSVSFSGQPIGSCRYPSVSDDGRYVAFFSSATNVVPGDTNGLGDIFVRDTVLGINSRVSLRSTGEQVNQEPFMRSEMSGDASKVVFFSTDSQLVPGDTNFAADVFVRDLNAGTTVRVSISDTEAQGNGISYGWSISRNGRLVAFHSDAGNLVIGDTNATSDVFVRDIQLQTTKRVSVGPAGVQGNNWSGEAQISADGSTVAFNSTASNLVTGDANGLADLFLHDLTSGSSLIASSSTAGMQADSYVVDFGVDPSGRYVAFSTSSPNPVPNDSNGFEDVFFHDSLGQRMVATTFALIQGSTLGSLASLTHSDNNHLVCEPAFTQLGVPQVQLVIESVSPTANPIGIELYVEASVPAPASTCFIYFYDFVALSYERVDVRTAGISDQYLIAHVDTPARFIGPNRKVRAKIDFLDEWPDFGPQWQAKVDHIMWSVRPPN